MTTISQYLRGERIDETEPASFYLPGVAQWGKLPHDYAERRRLTRQRGGPGEPQRLYITTDYEQESNNAECH